MFWFEIAYLKLDTYLVLNTVKQGYFDCLINFHSFSIISVFKLTMGYSRKNPKRGVWEYGISRGIKEILWDFWGLIKNEVEFPRETKKNTEFFVFGLGISKRSNTNLWNIQGLSFVMSGISWGKKEIKNSREVFKKVYPQSFSSPTPHASRFGFFLK